MRGILTAFVCTVLLCQSAAAIVGDAEIADYRIVRPALLVSRPHGACSAAMIGRDLVLTAGHCVTSTECVDLASPYGIDMTTESCVVTGTVKVAGRGSKWINAKAVVLHPQYNRNKRQGPDLALIQLETPLPQHLTPALISTRPIRPGDRLTIVGYGINDSGKQDYKARMATLTVDRSLRLFDPATLGEESKLGGAGGDSGGPAFDMRVGSPLLVGIMKQAGDALVGRRTVIEPIHGHREWIWSTAERLGSELGP